MKKLLWFVYRAANKVTCFLRGLLLLPRLSCKGVATVYHGVRIDCPVVRIGRNVTIYSNVHIFGSGKLTIGDDVVIGDGTAICVARELSIGKNTMIAAHCYLTDCNHGMHMGIEMRKQPMSIKPTRIGDDCWIGCGVKVLAGATVENGVVVGAGLVIDSRLESNYIYSGDRELSKSKRV